MDIFKRVKDQENATSLQLLPAVLAELDAISDSEARMQSCIQGVFAGNIFDLGAADTANMFDSGQMSFSKTKTALLPRPWLVDHLDAFLQSIHLSPCTKAVMFVDNAGADVVLGMLPLARELIKRGSGVILAANAGPTINDITAVELVPLLNLAAEQDAVIRRAVLEGSLKVVSSGSHLPVIDLTQVSEELCREADEVDLVILEGMGRAIETNLWARFTCRSLKLGMIKHPELATLMKGRLYDCVCAYDAGVQALEGNGSCVDQGERAHVLAV